MKASAYYGRTSTGNQEDDETIKNQLGEATNKALSDGYEIPPELQYEDDGYTGSIMARPALDQLRNDAKGKVFDRLYIYDYGRLSRTYAHVYLLLEELRENGVTVISVREGSADYSPEGQITQGMFQLVAEYERAKISERFRLGKKRKAESGKLVGYTAPYGYTYHPRVRFPQKIDGYFTVNPEEAKVVVMIYEWVGREGIALNEVIRRLSELGIPPRKQKRGTWTKGPIRRLLTNQTYIGTSHYYKSEAVISDKPKKDGEYSKHKKTGRKVRPRDDWQPAQVEQIIDNDLFEAVQHRLSLNVRYANRFNHRNPYLLTGLIECPCGKTRTGEGRSPATYYRCTDRLSKFPLKAECKESGINVAVLDSLVWKEIEQLISNPELVLEQAKQWLGNSQKSPSQHELIKKQLEKTLDEENRYAKAYGQGYLGEEVFQARIKDVTKRKTSLVAKLADLKPATSTRDEWTPETLTRAALASLPDMEFGDKKEIVRKLVDKVIATQKEATIWGHIPVEQQVKYGTNTRHRWAPQRRQIHAL